MAMRSPCTTLALLSILGAAPAAAQTLQSPTAVSATVDHDRVTKVGGGAAMWPGFIKVQVKGNFACPLGKKLHRISVRTDHDIVWLDPARSADGRTVYYTRTSPQLALISMVGLRQACAQGKSFVDAPVYLGATCIDPREPSFDRGVSQTQVRKQIRVALTCNQVTAPGHVPATATPRRYEHRCPTGLAHNYSSARPTPCGNYDPTAPVLATVRTTDAQHRCPPSWKLHGWAYRQLSFHTHTRQGGLHTALGDVQWCHPDLTPMSYFKQPKTVKRAVLRVNGLGAEPTVEVALDGWLQFTAGVPPHPAGKPVCKRADYLLTVQNERISLHHTYRDDGCRHPEQRIRISPGSNYADRLAVQACQRAAARHKRDGRWNSLPRFGSGRSFDEPMNLVIGVVGRYCFGGKTPPGKNWYYQVDCGELDYLNEWGATASFGVTLQCRMP